MKTNFTPQFQRDACYDGGGEGERPSLYSGYTGPTYVDNRSWFEKTINKTPTWLLASIVLSVFGGFLYIIILTLKILHNFISYDVMMISLLVLMVYCICYFMVKEMRND